MGSWCESCNMEAHGLAFRDSSTSRCWYYHLLMCSSAQMLLRDEQRWSTAGRFTVKAHRTHDT